MVNDQSFAVNENSGAGNFVGTVSASDADVGQSLSYAITGGTGQGLFNINSANGQITVATGASLDFEASASYTLTVVVSDSGSPSLSDNGTVTVNLNNLNEAPTFNSAGPFSLNENSAATTSVGTMSATDPDAGQSRTYSILNGNTGGAFAINSSTGEITVANAAALNYESVNVFNLLVQVKDNGSPSLSNETTVTVTLNDVNEAPVFNPTGSFSLSENSGAGTSVGSVSATDPDFFQTLTYSIVGGNTGGAFTINSHTGQITVANAAAVDYETNPSFSLTVRVSDNGSPSLAVMTSVSVSLIDVNETTPAFLFPHSLGRFRACSPRATSRRARPPTCGLSLDAAKKQYDKGNINPTVNRAEDIHQPGEQLHQLGRSDLRGRTAPDRGGQQPDRLGPEPDGERREQEVVSGGLVGRMERGAVDPPPVCFCRTAKIALSSVPGCPGTRAAAA